MRTGKVVNTMTPLAFAVMLSLGVACAVQAGPVWTEYSPDPVYSIGSKAYYPSILQNGSGYTMWYSTGTSIQTTTSTNGTSWTTATADTGLVANANHPVIENINGQYQIWYWDGNTTYTIGDIHTAVSTDGVHWTNDQALTQVGYTVVNGPSDGGAWNYGSYGACDVIYNAGGSSTIVAPVNAATVWANKYVMYYDGTTGHTEDIGIAVSNDGINWQGYDGGVAPVFAGDGLAWDSGYATFCSIVSSGSGYEMYYSGGASGDTTGIGYATSADGINWTGDADNPIFSVNDGVAWRNSRTYTPMVIGDQMWFTGESAGGAFGIGYATSPSSGAVPEPISMIFFGTGIVGVLGVVARKRTQRN